MERTMLRSVCAAGNLLAAVERDGTEEIKQGLMPVFNEMSEEMFGPERWDSELEMGLLLRRFLNLKTSPKVARVDRYTYLGLRFAKYCHSAGDSHICYRNKGSKCFGRIVDIVAYLQNSSSGYVALVTPFSPLNGKMRYLDPYRGWEEIAGQLFHADPEAPQLVSFDAIACQAMFRVYKEATGFRLVHLMALDKVRQLHTWETEKQTNSIIG